MPEQPRCRGMHRFLLVDSWTDQGAHASCLVCSGAIHADFEFLEKFYSEFQHYSDQGQDHDKTLLVLDKALQ